MSELDNADATRREQVRDFCVTLPSVVQGRRECLEATADTVLVAALLLHRQTWASGRQLSLDRGGPGVRHFCAVLPRRQRTEPFRRSGIQQRSTGTAVDAREWSPEAHWLFVDEDDDEFASARRSCTRYWPSEYI